MKGVGVNLPLHLLYPFVTYCKGTLDNLLVINFQLPVNYFGHDKIRSSDYYFENRCLKSSSAETHTDL